MVCLLCLVDLLGTCANDNAGHVCCDGCLIQWAARNNPPNRVDCPMCRKRHSYPKNTIKLFFEEEKSEPELFRSEVRSVIKLVQQCADEPSGATLANVVEELKAVSRTAKKLKEHQVSAVSPSWGWIVR